MHASEETSFDPCTASQAVQVRRTVQSSHKSFTSSGVST